MYFSTSWWFLWTKNVAFTDDIIKSFVFNGQICMSVLTCRSTMGRIPLKKNFEGWYRLNYTNIYPIQTSNKIHPVTTHYL